MTMAGKRSIDRASAEDVVSLATDVGPTPMQVGAIVVLDAAGRSFDAEGATDSIGERIRAVPRLRQRLMDAPPGGGRPAWVDDEGFDIANHVTTVRCPGSGDEQSLLDLAATLIARPFPRTRPLWSMTIVEGLERDRVALVVAFHHVLADGIGGLAVLAALVDGMEVPPTPPFPRPAPSPGELRLDRLCSTAAAVLRWGDSLRRLAAAGRELRPHNVDPIARCSLNRPTGGARSLRVVRVPLDRVRQVAHSHEATINDTLLAAVGASLGTILDERGEAVDTLVMSIPVSARRTASATSLGNEVGAVPVRVPAHGSLATRLRMTRDATRAAKAEPPGSTSALLGPLFRLLARLGVFRWFINRQHLVHTFVTNLRGPDDRLDMFDAPVTDIIAVALVPGNVTVSFAALSYAGTLAVTVVADPDTCPDLDDLAAALDEELHRAG